jgi:hypothetical protein
MSATIHILPTVAVERTGDGKASFTIRVDRALAAQIERCAARWNLSPAEYLTMLAIIDSTWPQGNGL